MKTNLRDLLSSLLGFAIWLPSLAIPIANAWGLQLVLPVSLLIILVYISNWTRATVSYSRGVIWTVSLSAVSILSAAFGAIAFSRSILSAVSELTLLVVAFAIYIVIIYSLKTCQALLDGFYVGGIFSAVIAVVQFVGLNLGITAFAWEFVNPSFSLLSTDSAIFHQRAYGLTPEPSVLSALLLSVIALQTMRVRRIGDHPEWLKLALLLVAALGTASQSLLFVPLAILSGFWISKNSVIANKKFLVTRFYFVVFTVFFSYGLTTVESFQRNFSSRVVEIFSGSAEESSFGSRSESILASFGMFLDYPLFGAGPGAVTDILTRWVRSGNDVGAASAFFRNIAELGFVYLLVWILATVTLCLMAYKIRKRGLFNEGQLVVIAFWFAMAAIAFVGYRMLYQNVAWFGIVFGLRQLLITSRSRFHQPLKA